MLFLLLILPVHSLKIAFGSCAGLYNMTNPDLWESILAWSPAAFVWVGDAIYADQMYMPLMFKPSEESIWKEKYNFLLRQPSYSALASSTKILGTWDDHDFGINNAKMNFPHKELARRLFLDFLGEPPESPRRTNNGIQVSYDFDENGKRLRLILLDDRSFHDREVIGEEQFQWLKEELDKPADCYLIMNGIQTLVQDRIIEWAEKVSARETERLLELVKDKKGVILASGDVHFSEIISYPCSKYMIHEITSSGLTHSVYTMYGTVPSTFIDYWHPLTFNIGKRVMDRNWGAIEIDFSQDNPTASISLIDSFGDILKKHSFGLNDIGKSNYLCQQSLKDRAYKHYLSIVGVFVVPLFMISLSGIIFIRKYLSSY